jgi:hypothetical protein
VIEPVFTDERQALGGDFPCLKKIISFSKNRMQIAIPVMISIM